jgi:hypothetical protein
MMTASVGRALGIRGYSHLDAAVVAATVGPGALADWAEFARSWNALELDGFMADGGAYRRRRYACYAVRGTRVERLPHQPHYQTTTANPLNGGIDRWFAPVDEATGRHPVMRRLLTICARTFAAGAGMSAARQSWLVEAHQFRIEATADADGLPTPEGVHRDGVDWVFVCLVGSSNVEGGVTTIHDADDRPLETFTLKAPLEAMVLDDRRVRHSVTPVRVRRREARAYRDVLVLTYRRGWFAGPRRLVGTRMRARAASPGTPKAFQRQTLPALTSEVELHAQLEEPRVENAERHQPPRVGRVQRQHIGGVEHIVDVEVDRRARV